MSSSREVGFGSSDFGSRSQHLNNTATESWKQTLKKEERTINRSDDEAISKLDFNQSTNHMSIFVKPEMIAPPKHSTHFYDSVHATSGFSPSASLTSPVSPSASGTFNSSANGMSLGLGRDAFLNSTKAASPGTKSGPVSPSVPSGGAPQHCLKCKAETTTCKHQRVRAAPKENFGSPVLTSHEIGWRPPIDTVDKSHGVRNMNV